MHTELDRELAATLEGLRRKQKLERDLGHTRELLRASDTELDALASRVEREGADVRKLEGLSFTGLLVAIFGDKRERLRVERKELAAAKLDYDERLEAAREFGDEAADLERRIAELGDLGERHRDVMLRKEQFLIESHGTAGRELTDLAEQLADLCAEGSGIEDAVLAADGALVALREVREALRGARNWGVFDMVGGGLIATACKHGKLDEAKTAANRAQRALRGLDRELDDLREHAAIEIEVGRFAKFADFFFDGLLTDWVVQSKIRRAADTVDDAIARVRTVRSELGGRVHDNGSSRERLEQRRVELIAGSGR